MKTARSTGFALVQSYIEARSLEEQVKAGRRFDETELKEIALQLLEILEYLHSFKPAVIHRDIKPSNILLADRTAHSVGQLYLVDFGSVQTLAAREGGTITVVGTYGYMPPEQFGGRVVPASDLYSLGATVISLASGRHPADLPQLQLQLQFRHAVQLSSAMVCWLEQLTQPDLGLRLGSAEAAHHQLSEWAQHNARTLPPMPEDSNIGLHRKGQRELEIIMPARRLKLAPIGGVPGLLEIIGQLLAYCSLLLIFILFGTSMLMAVVEIAPPSQFAIWSFIIAFVLACITGGWWWWRFMHQKTTIFSVNAKHIEICQSESTPRKLRASLAWRLIMSQRHLKLLLGDWELRFYGSAKELRWIESNLREVLDLSTRIQPLR